MEPRGGNKVLKDAVPGGNVESFGIIAEDYNAVTVTNRTQRQSVHLLDIRNVSITKHQVKIRFRDILRTTRQGFQQKEITIKAYAAGRRLCIVTVATEYLQRHPILAPKSVHQLFLVYQKQHNVVSTSSISRSVKEVMIASGLDVQIFTAHSMRAGSTSAALRGKLPIETILATAGWAKESTFRRYYNKSVAESDFGSVVMQVA